MTPTTTPDDTMTHGGISLGLNRIHRLLSLLQAPHTRVPVVHIAGTNGKGSVSAYLTSILDRAGVPVARFNSPHLVDEWDCIQLHGRSVSEDQFRAAKRRVEQTSLDHDVQATSFEVLTATAFSLFARAVPPVRVAVVEVGMGGAEDATNVVPADRTLLSVVTAIDLDHQKFLGDTVGAIARVKAGIIRPDGDVVVSQQSHEEATAAIRAVAAERRARIHQAGEAELVPDRHETGPSESPRSLPPAPLASIPLNAVDQPSAHLQARLPLPGSYQLQNAATAVLAASLLRTLNRTRNLVPELETALTDDAIIQGVEATEWPGRLSWLSIPSSTPDDEKLLLLDGAHNPSSAALLASYLASLPPHLRPDTLIFALSAPRDPSDVVRPLLEALTDGSEPLRVICCGFSPPVGMDWVRSTAPAELASRVEAEVARLTPGRHQRVQVTTAPNAEQALSMLGSGSKPAVAAGSLYLAADVMRFVRSRAQQ
ncbi:hypothetical protein BMF94_6697 [Rhodotorula taiwanensis]|uniref:Mur ligase central domain-containing protein n=1 Tax=Rhodotorula taiwanensis TaxID=741276 RepID=A0A2S5B0I7_9BASI|nr:hypothetical protein BMF94_6697 [Rhodotorula taiwanensis]